MVFYFLTLKHKYMKEKYLRRQYYLKELSKVFFLIKLTILFLLLGIFQTNAHIKGESDISPNTNPLKIKNEIEKIEKTGFYRSLYKRDDAALNSQVEIKTEKYSILQVMETLLKNTGLKYKFLPDNLAVIESSSIVDPEDIVITGKVTGAGGIPLAGATINVKNSTFSVASSSNGTYSISAPSDAILVVSYVGYQTAEINVNSRTTINISLQPTSTALSDIVVIGYQSVKRKDLTGSTGIVNMTDANKITSGSVAESLQGLVPGVTVRNGGAPGQNATIEIRGVGNFGNSNPLYVIDGMLADANTTVNTDDIASVQVLKDASAAAIYGSRAGNGVIIITTKKGKEGPAKFTFSAKYGAQQIPKKWNVMDAPNYLKTVNTAYQNSGVNLPAGVSSQLANNTINTNWQDEVFRTGNDQDYNLNISGGSATSSYLISGSYYDNKGPVIGNDFQRTSLRINTEAKKGILTIGENMMLSNTNGNNPGGGINVFYESASMLPTIAVQGDQYKTIQYNPAGWGMGTTDNPTYAANYVAVNSLDKVNYNFAKIVGNAYAELKFTNWLSYRFNAGVEASFDYTKEVRDTGIWRYTNQPPSTGINEDRERFTNLLLEHTLNFNKDFGLHNINGVIGFSRTEQKRDVTNAGRTVLQDVNGQYFTTIGSALGNPSADGGTPLFWRSHGYLGRINYTYNDKYLLTLTGRIDQDSRFGPNYRTGYFPSAAAAWRISKEKFFKVNWINDLKIRASYGKLGFSDVLGSWDYIGLLNNNPRAVYGASQTPLVGEYQAQIANPDLHWETRIQKNIGFDATLLDNHISISADVYNSLSKDVLVQLPLGQYLGSTGLPSANAGSIRNTGVEVVATYRNNNKTFKWDVSANVTTIKNRVLSVGNQGVDAAGNKVNYIEPTNFLRAQVGHSIGEWYVIKTDGIFKSQQEINSYVSKDGKLIQPDAKPGDIKYVDANGDGTINNNDRQFDGSPWPTLQAGAQFNGSYKNFNVNIQLVGVFGNTIYDDIRRVLDSYQLTNFRKDINPWSSTNPNGSDPRLAVDVPADPEVSLNNMAQTSRWLENASYVRLRNIEIGYSFSHNTLMKAGISNIHVYISGQNLVTITKYKGLDPDVQGTGIITRGFDAGNWPASRIFSVGLQFGF
jgi:TonB-dependent starch-binding outer membrane protein SusC